MENSKLSEHQIAELVERYPLPKDVKDNVLNRKQLALAFNVSENTIDKWIAAGMPVLEGGKNGRSYELQASHCWAWRQAKLQADRAATEAAEDTARAMRLALVGGTAGSGIDGLTPAQKRDVLTAQMAQEDFQRSRNLLIKREDVEGLLDDVFALTRDGISTLPDTLERKAGLKGRAIELSFEACDQVLELLKARMEEFFDVRPIKESATEREHLFDG